MLPFELAFSSLDLLGLFDIVDARAYEFMLLFAVEMVKFLYVHIFHFNYWPCVENLLLEMSPRNPGLPGIPLLGQAMAFAPKMGQESLRAGRLLPVSYPDLRANAQCH